jgi:hypothetical protein
MVIPEFTQSGVLPPFIEGQSPVESGAMAPFKVSLADFVEKFSTSEHRVEILRGFLAYRSEFKKIGLVSGFQWIDGSFVENVEKNRSRPPSDIDIVTFAERPVVNDEEAWANMANSRLDLFHPELAKNKYMCDAYFVDLMLPSRVIVNRTSYWFGLFSHQKESYLWKGMLEISLSDDEETALKVINEGGGNAS